MRLEHKVAVVTGAASGIGRASALRFAEEGAHVMAIDVNQQGLDETGQMIADAGLPIPSTFAADVSQSIQVRTAIERCFQDFGANRRGLFECPRSCWTVRLIDLPEEDWDTMFRVNVKAAFLLGKYAIPLMARGSGGSFIITASANSFYAESDIAGYCATKGAAMQLTRAMAIDHGPDGVRVNCILPRLDRDSHVVAVPDGGAGRARIRGQDRADGKSRAARGRRVRCLVPGFGRIVIRYGVGVRCRRRLDIWHDEGDRAYLRGNLISL